MTNGRIIEGNTEYSGFSDLNLATSFAGQYSNMATTVWWIAGSGDVQGLCASAELQSASHCTRNLGNPYAEKEARLRSQHYFHFGSGAGPNKIGSLWKN